MRKPLSILLILFTLGLFCSKTYGLLFPFSQDQIEAIKHCVHGYEGNFGATGVYYAGDAAAFNETIADIAKQETDPKNGRPYASKTITIRPGPMTVPDFLVDDDTIKTDWVVHSGHRQADGLGPDLSIEVWVGSSIKLDELVIPKGFTVKSGGEIEAFVKRHNERP